MLIYSNLFYLREISGRRWSTKKLIEIKTNNAHFRQNANWHCNIHAMAPVVRKHMALFFVALPAVKGEGSLASRSRVKLPQLACNTTSNTVVTQLKKKKNRFAKHQARFIRPSCARIYLSSGDSIA